MIAVREARLADPNSFDEERTWYRRHNNPLPKPGEENWAAEAAVVAEKRLRNPGPEEVGLGDSIFGGDGEEGAEDY